MKIIVINLMFHEKVIQSDYLNVVWLSCETVFFVIIIIIVCTMEAKLRNNNGNKKCMKEVEKNKNTRKSE